MAVNNMLSNVPGAVPYVSMVNDQANAVLINALNEKTKQYEQQLSAIAENEALLNQMKYRDPDRAGALLRAAKISSDLDKEIQEKYAGDYGSIGARKVVASRLAQERGIFSTLQQKYEEEQPYKQMYHQLKATGQLAKKKNPITGKIEEVNPFAQSIVDAEGNLVPQTNIDYGDIRKRGDYIGYVTENIVNPLNKRMQDLGLKYRQGPFYGTKTSIQRTKVGMSPEEAAATIDDNTAKRFLEENPNYAFEFGTDIEGAKNFIKDIVRHKVSEQIHPNYGNITDPLAALKYKEAMDRNAAKKAIPPRSLLQSKGQNAFNLKDLGYSNVRDILKASKEGDLNASDALTTLKNRLPENLKSSYEKIEKSMPQFWQKDFLNVKGFSKLSNADRLALVKDANTILHDKGVIADGASNIQIGQLMAKYGLGEYVKATADPTKSWLRQDLTIGAKKAYNTLLNTSQIVTQNIVGEPFMKKLQEKTKAVQGFNTRMKPYEDALQQAANEGINYEVKGFSPLDYESNQEVGKYLKSYGFENFKPIGSDYNSRSMNKETGYWTKKEFEDLNKGIEGVDFVSGGSGKAMTFNVRTKSGNTYPMVLDKTRIQDVNQFDLGMAVKTQTPEMYSTSIANNLEKQITYSKPIVGNNSIIEKMSREKAANRLGIEYQNLIKNGVIKSSEPYVYILTGSDGVPYGVSNTMNNIVDDFYELEQKVDDRISTPRDIFENTLRQYKASKAETNRYLDRPQ